MEKLKRSGGNVSAKRKLVYHETDNFVTSPVARSPRPGQLKRTRIGMWQKGLEAATDDDDSFPLTVEETTSSACKVKMEDDGTIIVKRLQVNLLSHCVFCFRKTSQHTCGTSTGTTQDDDPNLQIVQRANQLCFSSPFFLSTFNRTWLYLGKRKASKESDGGLFDNFLDSTGNGDERSTRFLELPTMCKICGDEMEKVYTLFMQLRSQLDVLGGLVKDSKYGGKYSWRAQHFERTLAGSDLIGDVIDATFNILDKLGKKSNSQMTDPIVKAAPQDNVAPNSDPTADQEDKSPSLDPASSYLQVILEETPLESPEQNVSPRCSSSKNVSAKTNVGLSQFGQTSNYVQVPNTGNAGSEDFVDENDDDWDDDEPAASFIKPEPEDRFNDEEYSENTADEWNNSKNLTPSQLPVPTTPIIYAEPRKLTLRQQLEQSGQLTSVVRLDTGVQEFVCKTEGCNRNYNSFMSFRDHYMEKHGEHSGEHTCGVCGKVYNRLSSLRAHKLNAHVRKLMADGAQLCDLCNEQISLQDIREHVRAHVGEDYLTPCPNPACLHVYSKSSSLYRHLKENGRCRESIPNIEEILEIAKATKCHVCEHKTRSRQSLQSHLRAIHEDTTKNFSCPIQGCSQQFTVRQSMELHLEQHDLRKKKPQLVKQEVGQMGEQVKREVADDMFLMDDSNQSPAAAHPEDPRYFCDLCDKSFARRYNLTIHKTTSHLKLRLHVCEICGESFAHRNVLLRHNLVHTGQRDFACSVCQQRFSRKDFLKMHLKSHQTRGSDFSPKGARTKPRKRIVKDEKFVNAPT